MKRTFIEAFLLSFAITLAALYILSLPKKGETFIREKTIVIDTIKVVDTIKIHKFIQSIKSDTIIRIHIDGKHYYIALKKANL